MQQKLNSNTENIRMQTKTEEKHTLRKKRLHLRKERDTGKKKGINDLTERGKRAKRKKRSEAMKAARAKAMTTVEMLLLLLVNVYLDFFSEVFHSVHNVVFTLSF